MLTQSQDWLYDEGEDASKAQYIAKMDEIKFSAGPVVQRYNDKLQEEREARLKVEEEAAAKKRAEADAKKKAEEEAKKTAEPAKTGDIDMKDADTTKPDSVEEPGAGK